MDRQLAAGGQQHHHLGEGRPGAEADGSGKGQPLLGRALRPVVDAEAFADDGPVHLGILAHVERDHVETEGADPPQQSFDAEQAGVLAAVAAAVGLMAVAATGVESILRARMGAESRAWEEATTRRLDDHFALVTRELERGVRAIADDPALAAKAEGGCSKSADKLIAMAKSENHSIQ